MPRINPEGQLTRAERLATVLAVAGAVLVHLVVILGWGRLSRWTQEEEKKERLMVIRRVRDIAPPPESLPVPPRQRLAPGPAGEEGVAPPGRKAPPPPPPEPKVRERGPEPPKESDLSPPMEQELQEQQPETPAAAAEHGDNSVSVVTDLPAASFLIAGAAQQYRGSGTFWVRKGAPPGAYTATFNPVAGFTTPPVQTKELVAKGQIVFVGKYRRSTEVVIESNVSTARVTVFRPDKRPIDLQRPGRTFIDDLPLGTYTAVFKDVPPLITPSPVSQTLAAGGRLSFYGEYREAPGGSGQGSAGAGSGRGGDEAGGGAGAAGRGPGRGGGTGSATGSGRKAPAAAVPEEGGLDRRVQMVVKSYPSTDIEHDFDPIPYPEVIIRRSNFQQGWCQVYLIVDVDGDGDVSRIAIERPNQESRAQFAALIGAVEAAVRSWDYDKVSAEVHVDVRFYVE